MIFLTVRQLRQTMDNGKAASMVAIDKHNGPLVSGKESCRVPMGIFFPPSVIDLSGKGL